LHFVHRTITAALACASLLATMLFVSAPALAISVQINGNTVALNPPPIERAGRVFVPLRGVFERLGATVVYANGQINASGNGHNISLRIGSNQAVVDGQTQTMDVAPFIVGASTYVPLRFVSSALGASVNWDNANQIVALTQYGGGGGGGAAPPPPAQSAFGLTNERPRNGTSVPSNHPTVRADFNGAVDPNSVRVYLDGLDVTNQTTRSQTGVIYAPASPLQAMQHSVMVSGNDQNGAPFRRSWTFVSGAGAAAGGSTTRTNFLNLTQPGNGATVGSTFTVEGRTVPNGQVHIVAGAVGNFGGFFTYNAGSFSGDTVADGNGHFSQTISLQSPSGAQVGLTVTSTDPLTNETSQRQLTLRVG
jgi:hypothetical protein